MAKKDKKTVQEHQEDALYREVWEEVRVQRFYDFMKKNIRIILAAAIIIVAAVATFEIIRHSNASRHSSDVLTYESAMAMASENQLDGAEVLLNRLAKSSRGGMGDLALYRAAQIDMASGKMSDAVSKLESLAKNGNVRDFQHLALIKIAVLKSDELDAKNFEKTLAPLMTKRSPFYYVAMILVAYRHADAGDKDAARNYVGKIVGDKNAPMIIAAEAETLSVYLQ